MNLIPLVDASSLMLNIAAAASSGANGTGIDASKYDGPAIVALCAKINSGTTVTFDWKLRESSDNSTYVDVAGAVATQVVTGTSNQVIPIGDLGERKQYLLGASTITGTTPSVDYAAFLIAQRKYA